MPTLKIETKPKREVLDLKDGKKQYYKTGKRAGEVKMKLKSAAKYKTELDIKRIFDIFNEHDVIVLENQNPRPGNSAMSSASTMKNFGKLMAAAELSQAKVVYVQPGVWKKYFDLTVSKEEKKTLKPSDYKKMSIKKAYDLTEWSTSYDGIADAICIGMYHIKSKE